MIKLVIFDLDGTLLFTLDSICLSLNKVLAAHDLPPQPPEHVKRFVGDGVIDLLKRAFHASGSSEEVGEQIVGEFRACFKDDCDYRVAPYEGMPELLAFLKKQHIAVACNTNKPHENALKLIHRHFPGDFSAVLGNQPEIPKKPDAAGVNLILRQTGVLAQEAVYVGDSDVDVFTAKHANVISIGAAWGYRGSAELAASGADFICDSPLQIIEIIRHLNER